MTTAQLLNIVLPNIRSPSQQNSETEENGENMDPNQIAKSSPSMQNSTNSSSTKHKNLKHVIDWPIIDGRNFGEQLDYLKDHLIIHIDQKFKHYEQSLISEGDTFGPENAFDSTFIPILKEIFGLRIFGKLEKTIGPRPLKTKNNSDLHWYKR